MGNLVGVKQHNFLKDPGINNREQKEAASALGSFLLLKVAAHCFVNPLSTTSFPFITEVKGKEVVDRGFTVTNTSFHRSQESI